jgi:hypothetical protein
MISSIKSSTTEPTKLQIDTIEPARTNDYIPGMIFYIRFVQLSKKFLDDRLSVKCGVVEPESQRVTIDTTRADIPKPRSASPPPMGRRGSFSNSEAWKKANPYVNPKSNAELYRR